MLDRVLEPEVMDDPSEAAAYHAMNHDRVNAIFVDDLRQAVGPGDWNGPILDLGSGNGLIPILLRETFSNNTVVALDAARSMLAIARNVAGAAQVRRLGWVQARAQRLPHSANAFPLVVSNSLIHHLPEPVLVFREAWRVLAPGGWAFFRDLFRPDNPAELARLVDKHAKGESPTARRLFAESLNAALTVEEVRQLVGVVGATGETVCASSDRHWTWCCRKPFAAMP